MSASELVQVKGLTEVAAESVIAAWKEEFAGLTADTKEGYEEVRKAIRLCVSKRTEIDDRRTGLNKEALEWQRKVNAEAKRLTALIVEIEEPLKAKKKAVDDEAARVKAELEAKQKAFVDGRIAKFVELTGKPCTMEQAETWTDTEYFEALEAGRVEKAQAEAEAARIAQEEQAKREALQAEQTKLAAERAEFERERAKQQEELERLRYEAQLRQQEIDAQRAQVERERREQQAAIDAERQRLEDEERARIVEAENQAKLKEIQDAIGQHAGDLHLVRDGLNRNCFQLKELVEHPVLGGVFRKVCDDLDTAVQAFMNQFQRFARPDDF
jgi:hypothetical protein